MKLRNIWLIASLLLSISIPTTAQDETAVEPYTVLEISGIISHLDKGLEDALVELFEGNQVVDAFETKSNGKFKFNLLNEKIYTIQITKKEFYTKRISVSTKMPAGMEDSFKFDFDIGMTLKEEASYDPILSEYPSALISFDAKRSEFRYDKDYTKTYFDEIEGANND
jgi:hypothetical protein